ncbi:hypothetical protein BJP36_35600 [Moorena producens JHB]|uniref:Uncharacterized protein n=1 Tax=Moorena producens (strain JHB) TaxID=1454205 RepID=A0A9Q9STL3_MOOP1|nr:hypothetical protein [Moorena producens]WAN69419.1 hypothetical protein BJP36_35600 [Moorena producens JHB]
MGETTAVAHGGNHGSRSWGGPPRPRCLPKTALPSQDRNGAFSVGELNSPRVAPLHRCRSVFLVFFLKLLC